MACGRESSSGQVTDFLSHDPFRADPQVRRTLGQAARSGLVTSCDVDQLDLVCAHYVPEVQRAAAHRFLRLGRLNLSRISDKAAWIRRCLLFEVSTQGVVSRLFGRVRDGRF